MAREGSSLPESPPRDAGLVTLQDTEAGKRLMASSHHRAPSFQLPEALQASLAHVQDLSPTWPDLWAPSPNCAKNQITRRQREKRVTGPRMRSTTLRNNHTTPHAYL